MPSNTRKSILIVLPVAPWPARQNGISIRYYPMIEALTKKYDVDLFVHSEPRQALPQDHVTTALRRLFVRNKDSSPPDLSDRIRTLSESFSPFGQPYKFSRYHAADVLHQLRRFTSGQSHDTVLWVMHEYRHLLNKLKHDWRSARIIYDSIDSPYLHHLRERTPAGFLYILRAMHVGKTRRWERKLLTGVNGTIYISGPDAEACTPQQSNSTAVIPNGIYLHEEDLHASSPSNVMSIGFLGNMAYAPNVRAALELHQRVFLPLKKLLPQLTLTIIGRAPCPEISALSGPDVEVTGTVDSIWPYINKVNVFVYPMKIGAGLQNKILEAMHAAKPVVTTEICLKSVGAREGHEILVGRTDGELRMLTQKLLQNPEYARQLGIQGKAYVDRTFNMEAVLEHFERFLFPQAHS